MTQIIAVVLRVPSYLVSFAAGSIAPCFGNFIYHHLDACSLSKPFYNGYTRVGIHLQETRTFTHLNELFDLKHGFGRSEGGSEVG